ncbi:ABC transporter permease subunit [Paenibacillus filicis]|uniref:ABC transporter permease subunit n=1 Tax=Paenibacillus filicis TaxID=669464 RepID=A0ABU9DFI9_9BACL
MPSITAGVWNETIKLASRKKTLFFLAVMIVLPVAAGILLSRFQSGIGIGAIASRDFPILMLNLFTMVFLPLFVFMGAADVFSGEQGDRTLKLVLTRPVSRFKVFASKQLALALYIALYLVAGLLASTLSALLFQQTSGIGMILDGLLAYGAAIVPLIVLSIAATFLAQFFSSSSTALTVSLLLYVAFKVMAFFLPQLATYSPTAYTDWHMLWLSGSLAGSKLTSIFMFLAACSILFFTAGFYVFDKKEI